jgi:hemoglobin
MVGGMAVVREVVDRFYDLVDQEEAYSRLRALHAPNLEPMRTSLTGFLAAWLGGPSDWFSDHPGVCMMSAHKDVAIDAATAGEWADAMTRAIRDSAIEPMLGEKMAGALSDLAMRMGRTT